MKKKLRKSKIKRLTQEQQENRRKNKEIQMIGRQALGFDKMKITGTKPRKLTPEELAEQEYNEKLIKLYTQTKLIYNPVFDRKSIKPFVIDWEETK